MDANGEIGDAKLGNMLSSTRLIDTIGATHGMNSSPTYIRGKTTIDFIFAMPGVLEAIQRCGITVFHQIITSDHTSIYVDLSIIQLFAGILHNLQVHLARRVGTKQSARSEKFREQATSNISSKEIEQKLTLLEEEYNKTGQFNKQKYKSIDQELPEAVMDAASSLPKVPKAWWTLEIGHKFRLLQYWRAKLSFQWNNVDRTHELQ
eukprot:10534513-Ditylum_brightwellii.AAC.1